MLRCSGRLENHERRERVAVAEYTIEHILPQNENLSPAWKAELGPEWKRVQETWLHTLGNLTLTGYNSDYSDKSFHDKRDLKDKGFRCSPLKLNAGLGQLENWNEDAIQKRAGRLADLALKIWSAPKLSADVLALYRPKVIANIDYTIADHPALVGGMKDLFEAFRKAVLALDPCVTEEFRKRYVAYKAETNFVDVYAQIRRLLLTINMTFDEINDPQGRCKDISDGRRNGDVEIGLATLRRDGFGYLSRHDAGDPGHCVTSLIPAASRGRKLFINASGLSKDAPITVELLDDHDRPIPGYSGTASARLTADGVRQPIVWPAPANDLPPNKPFAVRIHLPDNDDARMYAVYAE